jgi:hypothetical protein
MKKEEIKARNNHRKADANVSEEYPASVFRVYPGVCYLNLSSYCWYPGWYSSLEPLDYFKA